MKRSGMVFLAAAALLAGCAEAPLPTATPADADFAKAPKGEWTVTTLADGVGGSCTGGSCTLRAAIAAAQNGDRIVFKSNLSGTIALTAGQLHIVRPITIDGAGRITVDAQGASRVFLVQSTGTVALAGLTITGGRANQGGGIFNDGQLTLTDCVVTGNSGNNFGGGIMNAYNTLTLVNTRVVGNRAELDQGGFGRGGGIMNFGALTLVGSTVSGNEARGGGGIWINPDGDMLLSSSTVSDNVALEYGGGIRNTGRATVTRSTISGNSGLTGGIHNSHVMSVVSSTITRNTSSNGANAGGIYSAPGTATLTNTLVAGNVSVFIIDCEGILTSLGYNLSATGGGCPSNGAGDVVVAAAQIFTHVLASSLADNGGPTRTHAIVERGFAVDAGYCPGETTDQRGLARPYDEPLLPNVRDGCDIGAVEWRPAAASSGPGKGPKSQK